MHYEEQYQAHQESLQIGASTIDPGLPVIETVGKFVGDSYIANGDNDEEYEVSLEVIDPDLVANVIPWHEISLEDEITPTCIVTVVAFSPIRDNAITFVALGNFAELRAKIFGA